MWVFDFLLERIEALPNLFFSSTGGRLYWGYLLVTIPCLLIAYMAYPADTLYHSEANTQGSPRPRSMLGFLKYVLPARVYRHPSFVVDIKVMVFNHLFSPVIWIMEGTALVVLIGATSEVMRGAFAIQPITVEWNLLSMLLVGGVLYLAYDFARFLSHYLHHRISWLWEFHAVHHSAEELTPLTALRFHPLEETIEAVLVVLFVGVPTGAMAAFVDGQYLHYFQFVMGWFYARFFNLIGGNVRHMHCWLSWHPWLSHILLSPAQHQIHHSRAQHHWNKNYGIAFAGWDWLFGSLYVPREREQLQFGIPVREPLRSLSRAMLDPFTALLKRPLHIRTGGKSPHGAGPVIGH